MAAKLKRRAKQHGWSTQEEVRQILRKAAQEDRREVSRLGTRIASRFATTGLDADIPELRGQAAKPARF